jgi:hypothetical protein
MLCEAYVKKPICKKPYMLIVCEAYVKKPICKKAIYVNSM